MSGKGSISRTKSRRYISQLKRQEVEEEQKNLEAQRDTVQYAETKLHVSTFELDFIFRKLLERFLYNWFDEL